jgi:polyisoprenoid-binding protein YceI
MIRYLLFFIVFFISANLLAQKVNINDSQAKINFVFLDEDVEGFLEEFEFLGNLNLSQLEGSSISGSVATETLDTDNWIRNRVLRGKKYFSAKNHPTISFYSMTIVGNKDKFTVNGKLTIKGITRNVDFQFKNTGMKLTGTTNINTLDYDIAVYDERKRGEVKITVVLPYSIAN